jgi:peptidoglycan/xylan/chitin deacetylase (PgdA/CDA1 family)
MFDFDHPNKAILPLWRLMEQYGFKGNLFVNTSPMEKVYPGPVYMTWDELREVQASGWHVGSHTHNHMEMSYMARKDPSGKLIREQMERCDAILSEHLGVVPQDFAFTGTTWSQTAEDVVKERYRFARLWIVGSHYDTDTGPVRYADLVGVSGLDEADGGPPYAARYITKDTNPHRLPSMDLQYLVYEYDAFRTYLEGALVTEETPVEVT